MTLTFMSIFILFTLEPALLTSAFTDTNSIISKPSKYKSALSGLLPDNEVRAVVIHFFEPFGITLSKTTSPGKLVTERDLENLLGTWVKRYLDSNPKKEQVQRFFVLGSAFCKALVPKFTQFLTDSKGRYYTDASLPDYLEQEVTEILGAQKTRFLGNQRAGYGNEFGNNPHLAKVIGHVLILTSRAYQSGEPGRTFADKSTNETIQFFLSRELNANNGNLAWLKYHFELERKWHDIARNSSWLDWFNNDLARLKRFKKYLDWEDVFQKCVYYSRLEAMSMGKLYSMESLLNQKETQDSEKPLSDLVQTLDIGQGDELFHPDIDLHMEILEGILMDALRYSDAFTTTKHEEQAVWIFNYARLFAASIKLVKEKLLPDLYQPTVRNNPETQSNAMDKYGKRDLQLSYTRSYLLINPNPDNPTLLRWTYYSWRKRLTISLAREWIHFVIQYYYDKKSNSIPARAMAQYHNDFASALANSAKRHEMTQTLDDLLVRFVTSRDAVRKVSGNTSNVDDLIWPNW